MEFRLICSCGKILDSFKSLTDFGSNGYCECDCGMVYRVWFGKLTSDDQIDVDERIP